MEKITFACEIADNLLKVVKYTARAGDEKATITSLSQDLGSSADDKEITDKITGILKLLNYRNEKLIISLPRNIAVCRYIKLPKANPDEIDNIVKLQVRRYFPYPVEDAVYAYQLINGNAAGDLHIYLTIAPKSQVNRYITIFKNIKPQRLKVFLSSYGLCGLYNRINDRHPESALIISLDLIWTELAFISGGKLIFSRSIRFDAQNINWYERLADEIAKTVKIYMKQTLKTELLEFIIFGKSERSGELAGALEKTLLKRPEIVSCEHFFNFDPSFSYMGTRNDVGFFELIGLLASDMDDSLNFANKAITNRWFDCFRQKDFVKNTILATTALFFLLAGVSVSLYKKNIYLKKLQGDINKVEKEAAQLEGLKKRLDIFESGLFGSPTVLDVLYELHRITPDTVKLSLISWEDYRHLVFRGQAKNINSALSFAKELEKPGVFKGFDIELKHMVKSNLKDAEIIDFEIVCNKKENVKKPR